MPDEPEQVLEAARRCLAGDLASLPGLMGSDDALSLLLAGRILHQQGRHPEARAAWARLKPVEEIERACMEFQELLFASEAFGKAPFNAGSGLSRLEQFAVSLVAEYLGVSPAEALEIEPHENGKEWKTFVPDEDRVTREQVYRYYTESRRPILNELRQWTRISMATYLRWMAVHVARSIQAKSVFDFGGSVGVVTSAAAGAGIPRVVLFETSKTELEFARWRDARLGKRPPEYVGSDDVSGYSGQFDFGSCFEVLEHLWDVEGVVRILYDLLKPGGILMLTCSFGLYPHPEHMKKNVPYHGRELELLRSAGFQPVSIEGLLVRYPKMWFVQKPRA